MSLRSLGIYVAIVVATLLAGEAIARIYAWRPADIVQPAGDNLGASRYAHSWIGIGDLMPKQDGHWVTWFHRPYHVQTNSVGLRNAQEPSAKSFNILALGDSQTFGPYLANEDTWPAWTENALHRHYQDAERVQVFNAGIAGYTIRDELALLREKGLLLKPSLVVLGVFENDLHDLRKIVSQRPLVEQRPSMAGTRQSLPYTSALFSVAKDVKSRLQMAAAGVDVVRGEGSATARPSAVSDKDELSARYAELYRETVELLKSNGIAFAVLFIPAAEMKDSDSQMRPVIERLTRESGTPFLDVTPFLRTDEFATEKFYLLQRDAKGDGVTGNGHLSREGGAQIGRAVARWLVAQNLVPR
jgi:lysophospholipase L1-like esterase